MQNGDCADEGRGRMDLFRVRRREASSSQYQALEEGSRSGACDLGEMSCGVVSSRIRGVEESDDELKFLVFVRGGIWLSFFGAGSCGAMFHNAIR
jgi:hypothetical protein